MPTKNVRVISTALIREAIEVALTAAVNEVADNAHQRALKDVPVRKVFRYGRGPRTGARFQGRQETRLLSVKEAQGEAGIRRRLGIPGAFSGADSGRRVSGSQPDVQTALFPGNYRTRDRANDSRSLDRRQTFPIGGKNRLVTLHQSDVLTSAGIVRTIQVPQIDDRSRAAESDLSARGRYELKRRRNSAIVKLKGEQGRTLGGALRKTVQEGLTLAAPGGKRIQATISAGSEDVPYAKYVEFGTRHARAQPFLRPALAQAREELPDVVMSHLRAVGGS